MGKELRWRAPQIVKGLEGNWSSAGFPSYRDVLFVNKELTLPRGEESAQNIMLPCHLIFLIVFFYLHRFVLPTCALGYTVCSDSLLCYQLIYVRVHR